ncbi:UDP-N-acetyl-D-galactosamine:polypeptide N-acetylgalactosaminyltransferase T2, putative [Eimeria maxima]|uniref:UDP-N-acetyl-D-galactosamine:polypeptide N-acetylgalactosaminyltransferase T2, putative n=1 Tax=Eimeria maxima TaxID=5804 RepID=U6M1I9_EIMMA|nr:UDP-N-acetyl-D-galactosamine:polypeptide N-acetylgalactosaminyltransferase T2, putative [Eimeria maxima]CDJ57886.1 UDP-N-acetyl-D-galactosamine:polypeptide N-acetylgalactosaminyltransferase T2, putative [Eimeria maxima]
MGGVLPSSGAAGDKQSSTAAAGAAGAAGAAEGAAAAAGGGGGDPLRFIPRWSWAPLSSRFGKRTIEDGFNITDEFAQRYLDGK